MRKTLYALGAGAGPPSALSDQGPCDLSTVLSGFWCRSYQEAFEPDVVSDREYACPDCGRRLDVCEICLKRVPERDHGRSDVARVAYRCNICGAFRNSEGSCAVCGCGQRSRACSKSGTPPHSSGRHAPT